MTVMRNARVREVKNSCSENRVTIYMGNRASWALSSRFRSDAQNLAYGHEMDIRVVVIVVVILVLEHSMHHLKYCHHQGLVQVFDMCRVQLISM